MTGRRSCRGAGLRSGLVRLLVLWLCQQAVRAESDWQFWFDQAVGKDFSEKSSIRGAQSFRYSFDSGQLATYYLEAGYTHHPRKWLDLAVSFRQQYDRRGDRWMEENRPFGDITLRWKTKPVTLSDRSRFEYRMREDQADVFRYRNKVTVQRNRSLLREDMKPYVSAEGFVDEGLDLRERDRVRLAIGIKTDPEKHLLRFVRALPGRTLAMDYYVMTQRTEKDDQWVNEYIAAVQLGVHF